ncbi:MAG TPA: P-loop NTPase fold protein [Amycolatopsis sp.]|nr:P-loop NTPase fold protein [Amycolatopsis sp.]
MTNAPVFDKDGFTVADPVGTDSRFVVLNDAPVGERDAFDLLEAAESARSLADLIIASRASAPFTLAIDAAWGMGKSSLMHRLEATLAREQAVSTVWFNAWTSGRASALEGLIKSVLLRFDRNVIRRAVRAMSRKAHLLGALRASVLLVSSFFGLGRVVDEMWRALALDAKSRNQIKGVLQGMFDTWIAQGGRGGRSRLLVVFIDDLDRCGDERIVEVCEAIKLYLDVPGVVFVLACDQAVLWRAVRDSSGISESAGAVEYLEKIIQINYRIPVPSTSLALRLVNGYLDKSRTSRLFDDSMKNVIIERSGRNPRRIKRLINSFVLEYHLNRSWEDIGAENLVKVVLLQHFYPAFYGILANPRAEDPIAEFLTYYEIRSALRQGGERNMADWRALFQAKGLKPPESDVPDGVLAEQLTSLERELPREFPLLATDRDFVALIHSLNGPVNSTQLRRLLRRPLTPDFALEYRGLPEPETSDLTEFLREPRQTLRTAQLPRTLAMADPDSAALAGTSIVWIDDQPETNRSLITFLTARGASVVLATDRASALEAFQQGEPTVVLTDFGRGGDPDAGIDDLAFFRSTGRYEGPVLFCSGRGTAERRRRIDELGALGPTNDENEIVRLIFAIKSEQFRVGGTPRS